MRKGLMRFTWLASLAASWGLTWVQAGTAAEGPFRRLTNLFGGREEPAVKKAAGPSTVQDPARLTEILIELAWLEDPVTFPYYLEARVRQNKLYLRGYVPNLDIHKHALQVARKQTSLPVEDGLKEHPSLTVRQTKRTAAQLAEGVKRTMERAQPKRASELKIQCTADGNVILQGTVSSFEEKLALSQALRRQPGCVRVSNLTQVLGLETVAGTPAPVPSNPIPQAPVVRPTPRPVAGQPVAGQPGTGPVKSLGKGPVAAVPPGQAKQPPRQGFFQRLFGGPSKEQPPVQPVSRTTTPGQRAGVGSVVPAAPGAPAKLPVGPSVPTVPGPTAGQPVAGSSESPKVSSGLVVLENGQNKQGPTLPPAQVQKVLQRKITGIGPFRILQPQAGKLRIEMQARDQQEVERLAGQILALPELAPYGENVELHISIDPPKGK